MLQNVRKHQLIPEEVYSERNTPLQPLQGCSKINTDFTRTFVEVFNCNSERYLSRQTCAGAISHVGEDVRVHLIGKVAGNLADGG